MAKPARTKNRFLTPRRFFSLAAWRAPRAGLLVWPSAWLELDRQPSVEVRISRVVMGWWHWRAQAEFGTLDRIDYAGPVDWERIGIDGYLAWARKAFGQQWGRMEVDRLFRADPAWRRLALMGTARNHYVRVVLARAMLAEEGTMAQLGANRSLHVALSSPEAPGDQAQTEGHSVSMLDDLETLGHHIRAGAPGQNQKS